MRRKDSGQILVLKRLLSLCNERATAIGFTIDEIAKWPPIRKAGIKRNSIYQAIHRFVKLEIAFSPGLNSKRKPLFRIRHTDWANAYIEGDAQKPWLTLTPTPLVAEFPVVDEHRDHFDIELTLEWFEVLKRHAQIKNNQYTWRHKSFTISVNGVSLLGQLYIKPYWQSEIKRHFGQDFFEYITDMDRRGLRQGDFCLPLGMKGERLTLGGRPTQFSTSHWSPQLDVRAKKSDHNVRDGLYGLTNQGDFNIRVLDAMDALKAELQEIGDFLRGSTEKNLEFMNGVNANMKTIADLLKTAKEGEAEYQGKPQEREDYSYG